MPHKIEIKGQSLVISDVASSEIILDIPKNEVYYFHKFLKIDEIRLYENSKETENVEPIYFNKLTDVVNGQNIGFTKSTFETFARENLGFNTASGGSDANSIIEVVGTNFNTVTNLPLPTIVGDNLQDTAHLRCNNGSAYFNWNGTSWVFVNFIAIESTAQLDLRDTNNRNRDNHTGTQLASTISDFANTVRATVLTGLSLATSTAVTSTDSFLIAIGKLQSQLSSTWKSTGNAGTVQATNFIGTTDNVGLSFRTNNLIRATLNNLGGFFVGNGHTNVNALNGALNGILNAFVPTNRTTTAIQPNETALRLVKGGTSAIAYPSSADLQIGTYGVGINSLTRLNFRLGDGASDFPDTDVMTLQGNGNVGIGTTAPASRFHVNTPTQVATTAGSSQIIQRLQSNASNQVFLDLISRRHAAGTDWNGTNIRLQKAVDSAPMGFIDFGINGVAGSQGLGFGVNSTTHLSVDNNGNVGIGTRVPSSTFQLVGSFSAPITPTTTSLTVTASMYTINCQNLATAITVTLPTAVGIAGRIYIVKRDQGSTGSVTIATVSGQIQSLAGTFGANATLNALGSYGQALHFQSDGTNWHRIN